MIDVFLEIKGLTLVDPADLEEFERVMLDEVIPEIVRVTHERQKLAAESRQWLIWR